MHFTVQARCNFCHGTGETETTMYTEDIMDIVNNNIEDNAINKIAAIKEVRNHYGLGLKLAKDLVEGVIVLHNIILKNAKDVSYARRGVAEYEQAIGYNEESNYDYAGHEDSPPSAEEKLPW